jgi:hypothetical protein
LEMGVSLFAQASPDWDPPVLGTPHSWDRCPHPAFIGWDGVSQLLA